MDDAGFWKLIDETRAKSGGGAEAHAEALERELEQLPPNEIIEFDRLWHQRQAEAYRWDLWAAAYVINGGCSDDCFEYFRSFLIAQGQEVFSRALADPDSLGDVVEDPDDGEWEELAYAAMEAYEKTTGAELPALDMSDVPAEPTGEAWDEGDVERVVPRLAAKFA